MSDWSALRERVSGKWQIPLFVFSLFMLGGAFLRIAPGSKLPPIAEAVQVLDSFVSGELYDRAIVFAGRLIAEQEYAQSELGPVHLRLARAYYGEADRNRQQTASVGRRIVERYQLSASFGQSLTASDLEQIGWAHEWQRDYVGAVEYFQQAIDHGSQRRSSLLKHIISTHQRELASSPHDLFELLKTFQAEVEDQRLDLRLWGIEQEISVLEELGRLDEATTLLVRNEDSFRESDLRDRFAYLEAFVLYKMGHYDEAETFLRTIRNRVERGDEVHAMTGWLLGRVLLSDGGPQRPLEALSFFTDVITYHPDSAYALASRLGEAEAFAFLERHDDAISTYRIVIEDLESLHANRLVSVGVLRTSLGVMADAQREAGDPAASLAYTRLAAALVDPEDGEQATMLLQQLVRALSLRAGELDERAASEQRKDEDDSIVQATSNEARRLYAEAAETLLLLAKRNVLNQKRGAEWSWRAAELYVKSGNRQRGIDLYSTYATERPEDSLVPRAILRVAQLHRALGHLTEAIDAYKECYRRFPRTLDGSRALVPLAKCYLALGPGNEELAEKTLNVVLVDSEVFTPQAPEFAEALFLLGDVYNRRRSFEQAIATLEEALERYGDDPRAWRARYLLADSYRRSALALRVEMAEATFAGELQQMQDQADARLQRARELFGQLINEYEGRGMESLSRLERLYVCHAALYEADCYFETREFRQALKLYEEAAGTFKDDPAALAAYVQIINCHVFLGEGNDARAALARALILVDAIPDSVFAGSVSPETRKDWRRYFRWLGESELF